VPARRSPRCPSSARAAPFVRVFRVPARLPSSPAGSAPGQRTPTEGPPGRLRPESDPQTRLPVSAAHSLLDPVSATVTPSMQPQKGGDRRPLCVGRPRQVGKGPPSKSTRMRDEDPSVKRWSAVLTARAQDGGPDAGPVRLRPHRGGHCRPPRRRRRCLIAPVGRPAADTGWSPSFRPLHHAGKSLDWAGEAGGNRTRARFPADGVGKASRPRRAPEREHAGTAAILSPEAGGLD
jgi:hypothetical protein